MQGGPHGAPKGTPLPDWQQLSMHKLGSAANSPYAAQQATAGQHRASIALLQGGGAVTARRLYALAAVGGDDDMASYRASLAVSCRVLAWLGLAAPVSRLDTNLPSTTENASSTGGGVLAATAAGTAGGPGRNPHACALPPRLAAVLQRLL